MLLTNFPLGHQNNVPLHATARCLLWFHVTKSYDSARRKQQHERAVVMHDADYTTTYWMSLFNNIETFYSFRRHYFGLILTQRHRNARLFWCKRH